MTPVLTSHGLTLELRDTPVGPVIAPQPRWWRGLALILDQAATGAFPGIDDALAAGGEAGTSHYLLRRPEPGEDLSEARAYWRQRAGGEPSEDAYVIVVEFYDERAVVPRAVLIHMLERFRALRAGAAPSGP